MISRHSLALPRICLALKMLYCFGGDEENRTPDPLLARQVLSQLSYAPGFSLFCLPLWVVVGLSGLEPLTSRLSGVRSNQLSYRPVMHNGLRREPSKPNNITRMNVPDSKSPPGPSSRHRLHRKEVIQPHLPIRLPCYDFTPIIGPTLDGWLLSVTPPALGVTNFRGVTGGVYKARERIHRSMLTCDY